MRARADTHPDARGDRVARPRAAGPATGRPVGAITRPAVVLPVVGPVARRMRRRRLRERQAREPASAPPSAACPGRCPDATTTRRFGRLRARRRRAARLPRHGGTWSG